ncbi:Methyltransferase type 12 [Metarhizium robertsii ARSEF 23]|uniref:Methyltransferase type 12 n=1 Tax=Metarhizium robertsii (strain ARSEF 23 / ATCC MYA-3075) TaxID=655844 RepID=E9F6V2_METRA|nr:Methyltransferase type 12 [Metarhizium robertsii ARSEF 23]EFY96504.2 Methyltransferase type 12 [Metarhizium robertsii ARSEF 23]
MPHWHRHAWPRSPRCRIRNRARLFQCSNYSGGEKLKFVEASLQQGLTVLPRDTFDLVFISISSLCYVAKIKEWARIVSGLLKLGRRLFVREFHPVLLSLDDGKPDEMVINLPYFKREEPVIMDKQGTYINLGDYIFTSTRCAVFNHGIGEVVQALLHEGMRLTGLREHESALLTGA